MDNGSLFYEYDMGLVKSGYMDNGSRFTNTMGLVKGGYMDNGSRFTNTALLSLWIGG